MTRSIFFACFWLSIFGFSSNLLKAQDEESKERYVKVSSSSADAVVVDGTDFFEQKPLCTLLQNQTVTLLDSTDGEYVMIKFLCKGKEMKGWVKKVILSKKPIENHPRVTESGGVDSAHFAGPGTIGYGNIDTSGFKDKTIEEPWDSIDLTGNEAKIIAINTPHWNNDFLLPIGIVTAAGVGIVIGISNMNNENPMVNPKDTTILDSTIVDCDFTLTSTISNASCGYSDGSIVTTIDPPANYIYQWEDGTTSEDLINISSASYNLSVTDSLANCTLSYDFNVGENPASYMSNLFASPALCPNNGMISFELHTPDEGALEVLVNFNGSEFNFIVPFGPVLLNDFMPVEAGEYLFAVTAENANGDCSETFQAIVESGTTLIVDINDVSNPSSPTANDGAIFGTVLSTVPPPFELYVNGLPMIIDDVSFVLENLAGGNYAIYAIDQSGCISDTVFIILGSPPKLSSSFRFSAQYRMQPKHREFEKPGVFANENLYSLWLEWRNNINPLYPSLGLGYSSTSFFNDRNSPEWEFNLKWHKSARFDPLMIDLSAGPFIHFPHKFENNRLIGKEDLGLVFNASFRYDLFNGGNLLPISVSMNAGAFTYLTSTSMFPGISFGISAILKK